MEKIVRTVTIARYSVVMTMPAVLNADGDRHNAAAKREACEVEDTGEKPAAWDELVEKLRRGLHTALLSHNVLPVYSLCRTRLLHLAAHAGRGLFGLRVCGNHDVLSVAEVLVDYDAAALAGWNVTRRHLAAAKGATRTLHLQGSPVVLALCAEIAGGGGGSSLFLSCAFRRSCKSLGESSRASPSRRGGGCRAVGW